MKNTINKISLFAAVVLCLGISGCTWVKVSSAGENVKVLTMAQAASCERLGATTSKAANKVGFIKRKEGKLSTELETLARNEAAVMGGNAVAAEGEIDSEGRQKFIVYRCP